MAIKIQSRRDTASNWTNTNPIPHAGEVCLETDTLKLKMGNGSTAWTSLAYITDENFTSADHTKLDGIETGADITDSTNVEAAGALMDSEVTNLADVKAFDTTDYATSAQGTTADAALPKTGGAMTGAITTNSTFDGRTVSTDGTKLDGIEASATADQTDAEIRAAVEAATDSNVFTDADHTKLDGIEDSATADQTKADIEGLSIELPAANLTGTVDAARLDTATTQTAADNSTKVATTAYVETAVAAVVDTAPAALDTLNELAAALGDDANFATTTATSLGEKLPKAGGQMTGNITMAAAETVDGRDLSVDGAKLDLIEASATADQTGSEIKTAYEGEANTNAYTDAEVTKLAGVEALADVTDATNVATAGALMTSTLINTTDVQAFQSSDYVTTNDFNVGDYDTFIADTAMKVGGNANLTADQTMEDFVRMIFGTGADMWIYHDGSHSYIEDQGTGDLILKSADVVVDGNLKVEGITETVVSGSSITPNLSAASVFVVSSAGTLTMPTAVAGKSFTVVVNTGTHVTWSGSISWNGGAEPTKSAGIDTYVFVCADGSTWLGAQSGTGYA
jgi:hypothetical protein